MISCFDLRLRYLPIIRERWFHCFTAAVIAIALLGAFRIGLDRGFDHTIGPDAWGRLQNAIGSAITEMVYGKGGYIISHAVETALNDGGLTGDPEPLAKLGLKFPDNLRNGALIDAAIEKAVQLPETISSIRGMNDDLGMIDVARLGFTLFGYHLLAFYLTYFILFSVPIWLFFRAFRDRPAYLALLAVVTLAHVAVFGSGLFDLTEQSLPSYFRGQTLGSVTNPRFLSALAIIPGIHLALMMLLGFPPSRRNVVAAAGQAAMIVFACWIRASAIWIPLGLLLLALAIGLRARSYRPIWSFGLLAALWLLHAVYVEAALSSSYRKNGSLTYHPLWHAVFYSLQINPEWNAKYAAKYDYAALDELSAAVTKKYLERHSPDSLSKIYNSNGTMKWTAIESSVRAAFFEFFLDDPKFVLATFLIYTPRAVLLGLMAYVTSLERLSQAWLGAIVMIGLAMAGFFAVRDAERRAFIKGAVLVTAAFILSLAPVVLVVPVIAEQFFMLVIVGATWSIALSSLAIRSGISLSRSARLRYAAR